MKAITYNAIITQEEGGYVALNPEYDVASQGDSVEEALANLQEALDLYLEDQKKSGAAMPRPSFLTTFSL
jgi:predicted RNase H-like HicB family nuclease